MAPWRNRAALWALGMGVALAGCSLLDLSGLQGAGGLTGASTASTAASGGAGGSGPVIHKLFVVGGREVTSVPLSTIYSATIADDGLIQPFDPVVQLLPEPAEEFALAVVAPHVFVIGGITFDGGNQIVDRAATLVADVDRDGVFSPWATAPALLPSGGYASMGFATAGNQVFLAGGSNFAGDFTSDAIIRGDVDAGTIQTFTAPIATLPAATHDNRLIVADGLLIEIGGAASPTQVLTAQLRPDGTLGSALGQGPPLNVGHVTPCSASGVVGGVTRVYVVGGGGGSGVDSVEVASVTALALGTWQLSPITLPSPRYATGCFVFGDSLYVVGGVLPSDASTDEIVRFSLDPSSGIPTGLGSERKLPFPRGYHQVFVLDLPAP